MRLMGALVVLLASFMTSFAFGADRIPAPETAQDPSQPPAEQPKAEPTPPTADPGMVKQPETIPDPNSVVNPPVVDPKMAINPEASPQQPVEPRDQRPNRDQPQKSQ